MNKKELLNELKEIDDQIIALSSRKRNINKELDRIVDNIKIDFNVGDKIRTSVFEDGEIISVNGSTDYPIIALIHRRDVWSDDVAYFGWNGKLWGKSNKYTIEKKTN